MALLVPSPRGPAYYSNITGRPSNTWGTGLTASSTTHNLGTITEIVSAANNKYPTHLLRVRFAEVGGSATVTDMLVNLYVGAASSEVLLIDSLMAGWSAQMSTYQSALSYDFPLYIPAGTRISGAARSVIASDTVRVYLELVHLPGLHPWCGTGVETLGQVTASSRGTQVTPGAASEGSWTSIATSGRRYGYIQPMAIGNPDTTATGRMVALDIGASSTAIPGLSDFIFGITSSERAENGQEGRYCDIASGTALEARLQSSTADVEASSVIFYGVY